MAKFPTNPSQPHVPISLAPIQLLSQYWVSSLSDPYPTKNAHLTTNTSLTSPTKSIPRTAPTKWKSQSQYKHQPKKELPRKKTHGVHPNTNAICRSATIFAHQPNGYGEPGKGISTPLSPMVQSQCHLHLSWWCPGALYRAVCSPQA